MSFKCLYSKICPSVVSSVFFFVSSVFLQDTLKSSITLNYQNGYMYFFLIWFHLLSLYIHIALGFILHDV